MYIVQQTTARIHPADGQHDDVTCPVFMTEDLVKAVAFARRIDENGRTFAATETQGVRVYAIATELPDFDPDRVIFSRVPRRAFPRLGAEFIWEERWHQAEYKQHYAKLAAAL